MPNSFFDCIKSQIQASKPFVLYSDFGNISIKAILQTNNKTYTTSDFKEKGYVFSPFDNTIPTYLIPLGASKELQLDTTPISSKKNNPTSFKSDSTAHKNLIR